MTRKYDAIVVGSGPNGLAAAITMARGGRSVLVREAMTTAGGGMRTEALTLPGFIHDVCSAAHPLAAASPFFRGLPLEKHGLRWIHSPVPLAHPLDEGQAVLLRRSVEETASALGPDSQAYCRYMRAYMKDWEPLFDEILGPFLHIPRHPFRLARFGLDALRSANALARAKFHGARARALFAGIAAHGSTPLTWAGSAAIGVVLGIAGHAVGWPIPEGGSQSIARALLEYFRSLGGEIETSAPVERLSELPPSRWIFLDLTPRQILRVAGERLSPGYRRRLERFRYGPGVFKLDWALSGPIPWAAPEVAQAATVHLGGILEEIVASESAPIAGSAPLRPYVLLCQPSLFDPTRAPTGQHTAWAYAHVPHGSTSDFTARIEDQIERFAPGFRKLILARNTLGPADLERKNPNLIGGDIAGGLASLGQLLARPTLGFDPYATSEPSIRICSASTPPGPGVHGMCGFGAAKNCSL